MYRIPSVTRLVTTSALILITTACATQEPGLYGWGNYQSETYSYFRADSAPQEQIAHLEETLQKISAKNQTPPPGFHAHLGMLYAQVGEADKAVSAFQTEKSRFPESAKYMDFLLAKYTKAAKDK